MADPDYIYQLSERLHGNIDHDKKVIALRALQEHIEGAGYVAEADSITSAVKASLRSSNQALSSTALLFLSVYISLLYPVTPNTDHLEALSTTNHNVRLLVSSVTPSVFEKLGDQKERIRESARNALTELARAAYGVSGAQLSSSGKGKEVESSLGIFERLLREGGLAAKFARIREQSVLVLGPIRQLCDKYPVRPLLPVMVDLLADADPSVREASRTTLVALFLSASPAAKSDLKKELEKKGVRKQTLDAILKEVLAGGGGSLATPLLAASSAAAPATPTGFMPVDRSANGGSSAPSPALRASRGPSHAIASADSGSSSTAASQWYSKAALPPSDDIKRVYIASRSDLERTFQSFLPFFEGKETEHNWLQREQSTLKIRGMLKADIPQQFGGANFVACIKLMQEGILKSLASLRTTLSMHAACLLSELALALGDDLGPCVEGFLSALMRMAGFTKKIIANATQEAAAAILVHVSFRHLYLQLIWQALQEKNVATRVAGAHHLAVVLAAHVPQRKHSFEAHGGLDILDKYFRRGLADQNPEVKSKTREAFWKFYGVWANEAKVILNALDATVKKQVMAAAPPGLNLEAAIDVKPKSSGIPTRRPGGPSSAIVAAKRAASAKAAQERERKLAEEAAAAHEARLAAVRQQQQHHHQQQQHQPRYAPSHYIAAPYEGTPKPRRAVSGLNRSINQQGLHLSPIGSPSRAEAAQVPLPTSPPGSSASTPRPRTISIVSQPSSNDSSSGPRSPTAYISPRAPGNLQALRQRAVSSSSNSSGPPQSTLSGASSNHWKPSYAEEDEDEDLDADDDDEGDMTQRMGGGAVGAEEDETMQLTAPADASVDLMNFDSSFNLQHPSGPGGLGSAGGFAIGDDSMAFPDTPMAKPALRPISMQQSSQQPAAAASQPASAAMEPRSPTLSSSASTPGTAKKRSGLPRPASMSHRGPSPLSNRITSLEQQQASSSETADSTDSIGTRQHRPSKSVDLQSSSHSAAAAAQSSSSPSSKENRPIDSTAAAAAAAAVALSTSESSGTGLTDDQASASAASAKPHKWFLSRAARLENGATNLSPAKSKPESAEWIEALASGQADRRVFQRLLRLSSEFKVPPRVAPLNGAESAADIEPVLRPGRMAAPSSERTRHGALGLKMGKPEDHTLSLLRNSNHSKLGSATDTDLAIELWQDNDLFTRLLSALSHFLLSTPLAEMQVAGLVVLHKLLTNQHPLFVACSKESDLLDLCFTLRQQHTKPSWKGTTACLSILSTWALSTDPLLGFTSTATSLMRHLPSEGVYILGLSTLKTLTERLPAELIEDMLPSVAGLLYDAVHHEDAGVRQTGVEVLTAANAQLKGEYAVIFDVLAKAGEVQREKMDLLVYYFHRNASLSA